MCHTWSINFQLHSENVQHDDRSSEMGQQTRGNNGRCGAETPRSSQQRAINLLHSDVVAKQCSRKWVVLWEWLVTESFPDKELSLPQYAVDSLLNGKNFHRLTHRTKV